MIRTQPRNAGGPELHLALCEYAATGEGVRIMAAISRSQHHAEEVLKDKADPFFHRGVELKPLDFSDGQIQRGMRLIPLAEAAEALQADASGAGHFYCELYLNNA